MSKLAIAAALSALLLSGAAVAQDLTAPDTPGCTAAGGRPHVKVFDGNTGAQPEPAKAVLHVRKAGDDKRQDAQPEEGETAPRMRTQNNLKQMGLAEPCK